MYRYCTWYVGLGGDTQYTAEATATIVYSGPDDAMRCLSVCLCFDGFHSAEPMKRRILSVEISTFIAALLAFISKERLNSCCWCINNEAHHYQRHRNHRSRLLSSTPMTLSLRYRSQHGQHSFQLSFVNASITTTCVVALVY